MFWHDWHPTVQPCPHLFLLSKMHWWVGLLEYVRWWRRPRSSRFSQYNPRWPSWLCRCPHLWPQIPVILFFLMFAKSWLVTILGNMDLIVKEDSHSKNGWRHYKLTSKIQESTSSFHPRIIMMMFWIVSSNAHGLTNRLVISILLSLVKKYILMFM